MVKSKIPITIRPKFSFRFITVSILIAVLIEFAASFAVNYVVDRPPEPQITIIKEITPKAYSGLASWYDYDFTDSPGYSARHRTAASRDFPRGTCLRIVNLDNPALTYVRVNDHVKNHGVIVDLSSRAFADLANLSVGLIKVEVREVNQVLCQE